MARRNGEPTILTTRSPTDIREEPVKYRLPELQLEPVEPEIAAFVTDRREVRLVDAGQGIYYALDPTNYEVRRLGPDGVVTVVAGNGVGRDAGDGGPSVEASVRPRQLIVQSDGNLVLLTGGGVRRITPAGEIEALAPVDAQNALNAFAALPNRNFFAIQSGCAGAAWNYDPELGATRLSNTVRVAWDDDRNGWPLAAVHLASAVGVAVQPDGAPLLLTSTPTFGPCNQGTSPTQLVRLTSGMPRGFAGSFALAEEDGNTAYTFDEAGRHLRTFDTHFGHELASFGRDETGLLVAVVDADGRETRFARDAAGRLAAIVGPDGTRTDIELDADGRVRAIVSPGGARRTFAYDPNGGGLLQEYTDARGGVHSFEYDEVGRLVRDSDPAGGTKTLVPQETPTGVLVGLTTAEGRGTSYSAAGVSGAPQHREQLGATGLRTTTERLPSGGLAAARPNGAAVTIERAPDPRFRMMAPFVAAATLSLGDKRLALTERREVTLADAADPFSLVSETRRLTVAGRTTVTEWDVPSRTVTTTTPAGRVSVATIDERGRVVSVQRGSRVATTYAWSPEGRLLAAATGDRSHTFEYNGTGQVTRQVDPTGRETRFTYDAALRPSQVTDGEAQTLALGWDSAGNLTSVAPPGRPGHAQAFTPVDLLESYDPPAVPGVGAGATVYAYDRDGLLLTESRPDGVDVAAEHDLAGAVTALRSPGHEITFEREQGTGHVVRQVASPGDAVNLSWNGPLLTGVAQSGSAAGRLTFDYAADARLTGYRVNGGAAVTMGFDPDGLLLQAGPLTIARDPEHGDVTDVSSNGVDETFTYDEFGRLAEHAAAAGLVPLLHIQPAYDDADRIVEEHSTVDVDVMDCFYDYDRAGRLSAADCGAGASWHYEYGPNGNRTALVDAETGERTEATYDDQDRILTWGGVVYSHTANGERETRTDENGNATRYEYDPFGNLRRVDLPDGHSLEYVVDGRNRRTARLVDGVMTAGWLYGTGLGPLAEVDGEGNVVAIFVPSQHPTTPAAILREGRVYRVIADVRGSPRLVVRDDGEIVQRMSFGPCGEVLEDSNPGFQPFGFAGGLYDLATGLVRFGARDYDAETARWTAKDPIRFLGGDANVYSYVAHDPVGLVDPTGLRTLGVGLEGEAGALVNAPLSVMWAGDDAGNWGLVLTGGIGAVTDVGASVMIQAQVTTAATVFDLAGPGTSLGFTGGEGLQAGGAHVRGSTYEGNGMQIGVGAGLSPVAASAAATRSLVVGANPSQMLLDILSGRPGCALGRIRVTYPDGSSWSPRNRCQCK